MGMDPDIAISPDRVSVYNFRKEKDGTIVEEVEVTSEGIPDDVFKRVVESLYEESMNIYYRIRGPIR